MATIAPVLHSFPPELSDLLQEFHLTPVGLSEFGSKLFFAGPYVLKTSSTIASAREEAERMNWLRGKIEVPEVVWFDDDYVLMTRLRGVLLSEDASLASPSAMKGVLSRLRKVSPDNCPFDSSNLALLARARRLVEEGLIQRGKLSSEYGGASPEELLARAERVLPKCDEQAVIHGRLTLESILWGNGEFGGLVDAGLAGVGDPYRDLTFAAMSLGRSTGVSDADAMTILFGGSDWDRARFEFHRMLSEIL